MDTLDFPLSLFFKYFWLLAIGATFVNGIYIKIQSKKYIKHNPSLEEGYGKLIKNSRILLSIPWIIMGIGIVFGKIPSMFVFFENVRSLNPFILFFWASVFLLWAMLLVWVYFLRGAEFLAEHPSSLTSGIASPIVIKLFIALALAGGLWVFFLIWNAPLN